MNLPAGRKKKHLGQHFLHDQNIIKRIIKFIAPQPHENLIEIGPGAGALTVELLPYTSSLDVIELDRDVIPVLESNCEYAANLHVHVADVLKVDFAKFNPPLRLVGNLPYNISTPLLFHLLKYVVSIQDMHFMLQEEVAERIVALPGSKIYGRLSVMLQYYCQVDLLMKVGARSFAPPPKVNSAFVRLVPRQQPFVRVVDETNFSLVVRAAFSQRRKTVANSLKKIIAASVLEKIGINPELRPEKLSVDEFVLISNASLG